MRAGAFIMTAVAAGALAGCATGSQSDEPLWRNPPPAPSLQKTVVRSHPSEIPAKPVVVLSVVQEQLRKPIPVSIYFVNANEHSVMGLLRRWARAAKVDFSWSSAIDYPVSPSIRSIETTSFEGAIDAVRLALQGVEQPLTFSLSSNGLVIEPRQRADDQKPLQSVAAAPAPAPAPAVELQPVAAAPAPAPAPAVDLQPVATAPAPAPAPAVELQPVAAARAAAVASHGAGPRIRAEDALQWDAAARAAAGALPLSWEIGTSPSLRSVVEAWGRAAGIRVVWDATTDYPVPDAIRAGRFVGTFKEALSQLAVGFGQLPVPVGMRFTEQGRVVRVFNL